MKLFQFDNDEDKEMTAWKAEQYIIRKMRKMAHGEYMEMGIRRLG